MKIAFVTPWEESVPPKKYGGIELVVYNIIEELTRLGHETILLGTGDSHTSAKQLDIFEKSTRTMPYSADILAREANTFLGISRAVEKLQWINADIVHNHLGWRFLMFEKMVHQPIVTTIHLPLDAPYEQDMYTRGSEGSFVSISNSQRLPLPDLHYIENVYNGIDVASFTFQENHQGYLVFLGSFTAHKGPDKAIEIAKKTKHRLILAGKIDPLEVDYFESKIRPHIDGDQIQFIGEVDHEQKNGLLGGAKAFLMPISWSEPFGLVMVEAMACGVPVIAMKKGSTAEIIDHGVNGFLCDSIGEMIDSLRYVDQLDRKMCRKNVEENFSAKKMVEGYLRVYNHVVSHYTSPPTPLNRTKKKHYKAKQALVLKSQIKSSKAKTHKRISMHKK